MLAVESCLPLVAGEEELLALPPDLLRYNSASCVSVVGDVSGLLSLATLNPIVPLTTGGLSKSSIRYSLVASSK